jgi:sugar phosphate isomerase/epimerase
MKALKFSAVVSTQRSGFGALPFQAVDCQEVFPRIHDMGFEAVELAVRDPFFLGIEDVARALAASGLRLSALGTGQAYVDDGISLAARDPKVFEAAKERLRDHIALASLFPGCRVIIGCIRGRLADWRSERSKGLDQFRGAMREIAELADKKRVGLLVEPVNRYETEIINTIEECLDLIDFCATSNVQVLADTFHMNIEEADFRKSLVQCGARLGHVHLADSNRSVPGTGHFNFKSFFEVLGEIEYAGDVCFEMVPGRDPFDTLETGIRYVRSVAPSEAGSPAKGGDRCGTGRNSR